MTHFQRLLGVFAGFATGAAILIHSEIVEMELRAAPRPVRELLDSLDDRQKRLTAITEKTKELAEAYIEAGVVGPRWRDDCLHVAVATTVEADAIISWSFKHIVKLDKIKAYNEVNVRLGYGILRS